TDHFVGMIALDALGAGIPTGHDAVWVQHEEAVVGHVADQHPELPLALAQRVLGGLPLRDIARDLGEAFELSRLAADWPHGDGGPEAAAVLPHTPALRFVVTLARCRLQHARRQSGSAILASVEFRDVMADDLVGLVALQSLAAAVPVGDDAIGIEH